MQLDVRNGEYITLGVNGALRTLVGDHAELDVWNHAHTDWQRQSALRDIRIEAKYDTVLVRVPDLAYMPNLGLEIAGLDNRRREPAAAGLRVATPAKLPRASGRKARPCDSAEYIDVDAQEDEVCVKTERVTRSQSRGAHGGVKPEPSLEDHVPRVREVYRVKCATGKRARDEEDLPEVPGPFGDRNAKRVKQEVLEEVQNLDWAAGTTANEDGNYIYDVDKLYGDN